MRGTVHWVDLSGGGTVGYRGSLGPDPCAVPMGQLHLDTHVHDCDLEMRLELGCKEEGEMVLHELKTPSSDELLDQAFGALFEGTDVQSDLHVHVVGIVHYHLLVHDVVVVDSAAGQVFDQQEYSYKHRFLQNLALELEELS